MAHSRKLTTNLIRRRVALKALAISTASFWRHWNTVFTDPRSPDDRHMGIERKVYEDELVIAQEHGGRGTKAAIAVMNYRKEMKRL